MSDQTDLRTVPSFVFYQGKINEGNAERPIEVSFYRGTIELQQQGDYDTPEKILISNTHAKELFKEIMRQYPHAQEYLDMK